MDSREEGFSSVTVQYHSVVLNTEEPQVQNQSALILNSLKEKSLLNLILIGVGMFSYS